MGILWVVLWQADSFVTEHVLRADDFGFFIVEIEFFVKDVALGWLRVILSDRVGARSHNYGVPLCVSPAIA